MGSHGFTEDVSHIVELRQNRQLALLKRSAKNYKTLWQNYKEGVDISSRGSLGGQQEVKNLWNLWYFQERIREGIEGTEEGTWEQIRGSDWGGPCPGVFDWLRQTTWLKAPSRSEFVSLLGPLHSPPPPPPDPLLLSEPLIAGFPPQLLFWIYWVSGADLGPPPHPTPNFEAQIFVSKLSLPHPPYTNPGSASEQRS